MNENIKQGSIIKTPLGWMVVVNADFNTGQLQGYQIKTNKSNKPFIANYWGEDVEIIEDFNTKDVERET